MSIVNVAHAQGDLLVYNAKIIAAPQYQFNASDPWSVLTTGNPIAIALIEVSSNGIRLKSYEGDNRYQHLIVELLSQIINQHVPGRNSNYYHVALGPDGKTYRCGPAQLVEGGASVFYYYKGKLLYGAILSQPGTSRGQIYVVAVTYTLVAGDSSICSDPLIDGPDMALISVASIAVAVGAAYSILRLRPRRTPVTPIAEY